MIRDYVARSLGFKQLALAQLHEEANIVLRT
jgi:hypothetical protein